MEISDKSRGWYGLGPVSVRPDLHGQGVGNALIRAGLERLEGGGAAGCILVGDPGYYYRFGFAAIPGLEMEGVPPEAVLALSFSENPPPPGRSVSTRRFSNSAGRLIHPPGRTP